MSEVLVLAAMGFAVAAAGTLIGAGGGFLMVPMLLYMYPEQSAESLTAISLCVVFFNSFSGSIAYARKKRINYKSGIVFAIFSVPGAIVGVEVVKIVDRTYFEPIFASVLILVAAYLFIFPESRKNLKGSAHEFHISNKNLTIGALLSIVVGFISSFLGIGGGIVHVPTLTHLLAFPVHIATATSHFVLATTAFAGAGYHFLRGDLSENLFRIGILGSAALVGAQAGAHLSEKLHGKWIIRSLSIGLLLVGFRIFLMRIWGQ